MVTQEASPDVKAVFFDAGLCLLSPDGGTLAKAIELQMAQLVDPAVCLEAYRRCIHLRDVRGCPEDQFAWWSEWCRFCGLPLSRATALGHLTDELEESRVRLWRVQEPGAQNVLDVLHRRGYRVAILSNSNGHLRDQFRAAGLDVYVDEFIDSVVEKVRKPGPALFELGLARLGLAAREAAFVGDDYLLDVAPALAIGFGRVLHYDPMNLYAEGWLHERIRDLNEIPARLTNR